MDLVVVFLFGLAIGSFLLVLIDRLPKELPVISSRSQCDYCKHVLSPLDLVPVFSYVMLRGKCRYCHRKLSLKYPLMELFIGLSFVTLYLFTQLSPVSYPLILLSSFYLFIFLAIIFSTLIVIFFTDLLEGVIPLYVVVFGVLVTGVYLGLSNPIILLSHVTTALVTMLFFLTIFFITKMRGIGSGDVIYAFYMGLLLGYPMIIVGLYVAFLTGAIVSIILVLSRKKKLRGDSVPFGPFLILGTLTALIFGDSLWSTAKVYLGI